MQVKLSYIFIMDIYDELLKKLDELPKGYLSKKVINKTNHYYLQWRDRNKLISKYLKNSEVLDTKKLIKKRKEIERLIKIYEEQNFKKLPILKTNARELNGYLMDGNNVIASFEKGVMFTANYDLLPLYLKRTKDINSWLKSRVIDRHRTNSRILKKF